MRTMLRYCLTGLALSAAAAANAETMLCTEVVPPTTITQPGRYCLFKDYALSLESGAAIDIRANNVVLDMNGYRITNGAAGPSNRATGITTFREPGNGAQSITIRNGTLRGFLIGIRLFQPSVSAGHVIEDMLIDKSLSTGIWVQSNASTIRRNRITGTGSNSGSNFGSFGIDVMGRNSNVTDNEITEVQARMRAVGIFMDGDMQHRGSNIISGNKINDLRAGKGYDEIAIEAIKEALISDNRIIDIESPDGGTTYGIRAHEVTVSIVSNVVQVTGTAYSGGTQLAGANH